MAFLPFFLMAEVLSPFLAAFLDLPLSFSLEILEFSFLILALSLALLAPPLALLGFGWARA
jgi:hypothetical protein